MSILPYFGAFERGILKTVKSFIHKYYSAIFILFLALIAGISFYLGRISASKATGQGGIVFSCPNSVLEAQKITTPITALQQNAKVQEESPAEEGTTTFQGVYMGSKNGTKYYTPGCPASQRIKPENVIWFQSVEDATVQGYSRGSC